MNVRLLGLLICFIGAGFALYSFVEHDEAKATIAAIEMKTTYRKMGMEVRSDLDGVSRYDLLVKRDESRRNITYGLLISALGFAVAIAASGKRKDSKEVPGEVPK